jgi:hypothetical protein
MKVFLQSQVFVLLDKDPGESPTWDNSSNPMVLTNQGGSPVLAMFTHPDRSQGWTERTPQFQFGLLTDFAWLVKGIGPGVGIVVNPGLPVGMEIPAHGVAALKAQAADLA